MRILNILATREPCLGILTPDQTVLEAVRLMVSRDLSAILVANEGELVGILTHSDIVYRLVAKDRRAGDVAVQAVMTREPVTVEPNEYVREAVAKMRQSNCQHLPVVIGGQAADTLAMRDLLQIELGDRERDLEHLEGYVRGERST